MKSCSARPKGMQINLRAQLVRSIKSALRCVPPMEAGSLGADTMRKFRRRLFMNPVVVCEPYHSQYGQDAEVGAYLDHMRDGVFLDIGAHDGVSYSNSLYLERALGWTGVCVEPNPVVFERLRSARTCRCLNVGIGAEPGVLPFTALDGYGEMLSKFGEPTDRMLETARERDLTVRRYDVPVRTVADILSGCGIEHVDYLSIDTEGLEFSILQSIDVRRLGVRVITIENNFEDDRLELYLRGKGFLLRAILGSDLLMVKAS